MREFELVPLPVRPGDLERILQWNLDVWGTRIPGYDQAGWRAFYERCLLSDYEHFDGESELAWVIIYEGEAIGSIALVHEDDLPAFEHLSPWLAAFVIDPQRRHQGLGRAVVHDFEEMVRALGMSTLYLWTDVYTDWYRSLGYSVVEHSTIGEIDMDVMVKEL
jgi:N-acetylglutamate synthase-like GNAT family acetyltransferase